MQQLPAPSVRSVSLPAAAAVARPDLPVTPSSSLALSLPGAEPPAELDRPYPRAQNPSNQRLRGWLLGPESVTLLAFFSSARAPPGLDDRPQRAVADPSLLRLFPSPPSPLPAFGLAAAVLFAGLAGWYILLRRRRARQGLPPPQPFSWLTRGRAAGGSSGQPPAAAKRGWAADPSERAWDTLGDDEEDGFGPGPGAYGMGGLRSPRRPGGAATGAYGQGGLSSPGLNEDGDRRRERFDSLEPEGTTYDDDAHRADTHPYGVAGGASAGSGGGQYAPAGAADSALSLHSAASSSPPRAPFAHFANGADPTASSSTIRLVPAPGQAGPMRDPFGDDDAGSTFSRDTAPDDDDDDGDRHDHTTAASRTVRPSHDRGDSTGSRFVEGA